MCHKKESEESFRVLIKIYIEENLNLKVTVALM